MQETTNLKLKKPDLTDYVNVGDLNENSDKIDAAIQMEKERVTTHLADMASQEFGKGASLVGVHDTDALFTSTTVEGALKEAITQANAAFTSASNGKSVIGNAVTGVDSSIVIPPDPTFNDLATAIGSISTGKKWASGTISDSGLVSVMVRGLDFSPKYVMIQQANASGDTSSSALFLSPVTGYKWGIIRSSGTSVGLLTQAAGVNELFEDGFKIQHNVNTFGSVWVAYE